MKLLVVGGTRFMGRAFVEQALAQGHEITLANRGRSGPSLFPGVRHLAFDRDARPQPALEGGPWDAVLDTCAYVPRHVRTLAAALQGRVGRYLLVSSISVYADGVQAGSDEGAPLQTLPDPATESVTGETYGGLKALCETALREALPDAALVARPGLLVGPHDPTGRFTWWVRRIARGGEVLAPGDPAAPVQFIDARDAAAWLLRQAEAGRTGTFNLVGPSRPLTMGTWLETARSTLNPAAQLHWVDETFLLAQGVAPWSDLPLWLTAAEAGMHATGIGRALATGLHTRPLEATLADTLAWARAAGETDREGTGLAPEREAALLQAWRARR